MWWEGGRKESVRQSVCVCETVCVVRERGGGRMFVCVREGVCERERMCARVCVCVWSH